MGTVWKCCVVAVVLCDLSSFGLDSPSDPGRGFQFNCGQDLCTFPHQYCDTDDYRCLYCSDDLCHTKDLPDQCRSYCKDIIQRPSTLATTQEILRNLTREYLEETMQDNLAIPLWLIVSILLLILGFLIGFLIYFCCSKYNRRKNTLITNPCDDNHEAYNMTSMSTPEAALHFESERKTFLDKKESFDSGNSSIEGTMPSSSSTASSVTQPQEVGESRHHERHIEHELLKNSRPESSTKESDTGLTSRENSGNTTDRPSSTNSFLTFQPDSFSSNTEDTCLKSNS